MGNVSRKGGNHKVARPMATTQLKMEDACNLWVKTHYIRSKLATQNPILESKSSIFF
jgi:hypothetical protein